MKKRREKPAQTRLVSVRSHNSAFHAYLGNRELGWLAAAFILSVSLLPIAAEWPISRLWGAAGFSSFPFVIRIVLVILIILSPLAAFQIFASQESLAGHRSSPKRSAFLPASILLAASFTLLFYIFRAKTHFLGDGYAALSNLASVEPLIKGRGYGEGIAHLLLARSLGGHSVESALSSYQVISIGSGIGVVVMVAWVSARLFADTLQRTLFTLGCLSGGYMLLYFGYVENYSLFVLTVMAFVLTGVMASRGLLPRWVPLVPLLFSVFFHIFGVALLPPAALLLLPPPRADSTGACGWNVKRLAIASICLAVAAASFYFAYSNNAFLRTALLTPNPTALTIQGYTLFSSDHILDLLSLFYMLAPAFLLLPILILLSRMKPLTAPREYQFLAVCIVSSFAVVFACDPKLGMPRDWDLFSFAAVPVVVFLSLVILDSRLTLPKRNVVAVAAIAIGFVVLGSRAFVLASPSLGLTQIENYVALDPVKGKAAVVALIEYHTSLGDTVARERWLSRWRSYPEEDLVRQADQLIRQGRSSDALPLLRAAAAANPMATMVRTYMWIALVELGKCDEAEKALDIAKGLNPTDPFVLIGEGRVRECRGDMANAESAIKKAVARRAWDAEVHYQLAQFYRRTGHQDQYCSALIDAARQSNSTEAMYLELGDLLVQRKEWDRAAFIFQRAVQRGMDTSLVVQRIEANPGLQPFFAQPSQPTQ